MRINNNYYDSGVNVVVGNTYLMVFRIIFNNNNTEVNLYINPTNLGNQLPTTPTLSQNSGRSNIRRSLSVFLGDMHSNGSIDEVRFASSYACVTPDAEVTVNLPPQASFTSSTTNGQRPLNINFNGSASFDPEGQNITYAWNFGDGSPVVSGNAVVSHTFTALGHLPVSLTVTDNLGLQHTNTQLVTILDENGVPLFNFLDTITICIMWASQWKNNQRISCNERHADFPSLIADALDAVDAKEADVRRAAAALGCSTSQLVRFLARMPEALQRVNEARAVRGLHRLLP